MTAHECCEYCDQVATCNDCGCCNDCCTCEVASPDSDWDEDFGGYPDEEPARWARHCRAMQRAMDEGVD